MILLLTCYLTVDAHFPFISVGFNTQQLGSMFHSDLLANI